VGQGPVQKKPENSYSNGPVQEEGLGKRVPLAPVGDDLQFIMMN
jgi:hypothetical protein